MPQEDAKWGRLARYLAGECSREEQTRLERWVRADAEREGLLAWLRRIWEVSGTSPSEPPPGEVDVDADWEQLSRKMHAGEAGASILGRRPALHHQAASRAARRRSVSSYRQFAGVAVLVVLLIGAGFLGLKIWGGVPLGEPPVREIVTRPGERATLQLADGTTVTLNVDSRLRVAESFSQGEARAVHLEGEAYFDVAPHARRPFIVQAGEAIVRVKGTAFNIEAYPEGRDVEVAVAEGVVELTSGLEQAPLVRLEHGQLGRLEDGGTRVAKEKADVSAYLNWTQGRLVFKNTPLLEVATRLERWYDVECIIEGDVPQSRHLTAALNSQSIRDVLDVITMSLGLQYRIEGKTVYLREKDY